MCIIERHYYGIDGIHFAQLLHACVYMVLDHAGMTYFVTLYHMYIYIV